MRIERMEETTEANRVAAASVGGGRDHGLAECAQDDRVARLLPALARLLSCSTAAPRSAVLAQAAKLLGTALGADHVGIYLSEHLLEAESEPLPARAAARFILAGSTGVDEIDVITLSPAEAAGRRLLESRSARVVRSFPRSLRALSSSAATAPGWSRIHSTLQVACPGQNGLLALISLAGPLLAARVSQGLAEQIEAAASLLAGHLERDRLGRELAALRAEKARTQRLAALGRVASSAAHDFNNVLTTIVGYADLVELELPGGAACVPGSPGRLELEQIRIAASRGAKLVEDVLAFGRKRPSGEQEVDLAQAVDRLDGMLRRVAGEGIELQARSEAGLPRVRMDLERFERILVNLVANARHAIEACPGRQGRIQLSLDGGHPVGAESVCLRVRDNGCGMDAIVKRRLFEPFFTTRGAEGGTGLGLADVADFARRAGATIEVESTPGVGCELALRFPIANGLSRAAAHSAPFARPSPV